MGQSQSEEDQEKFLQEFQARYDFCKEANDPRLGEIQIYKERNMDNYVFTKGVWCQSEEEFVNFIKLCAKTQSFNHRCIAKLIGFNQNSETQLCGDFSKVTIYYEYYPHNMEKELDKRHAKTEYFTEPEVWYVLESIVSACNFFEQQKIYHGDLRPINLMLNGNGQVKLFDHQLLNQEKNGYVKTLSHGENTYLSPQQLEALSRREMHPAANPSKSDVFSLGMTMLEVCSLFTSRSCYDFQTFKINWVVVDQLFQTCRQRYSLFLMNVIQEMLNEDENQRISFLEISQILSPYTELIQNLQPFQPDYNTIMQNNQVITNPQPVQLVQSQTPQKLITSNGISSQVIIQQQPQSAQLPNNFNSQVLQTPIRYQQSQVPNQEVFIQQPQQQPEVAQYMVNHQVPVYTSQLIQPATIVQQKQKDSPLSNYQLSTQKIINSQGQQQQVIGTNMIGEQPPIQMLDHQFATIQPQIYQSQPGLIYRSIPANGIVTQQQVANQGISSQEFQSQLQQQLVLQPISVAQQQPSQQQSTKYIVQNDQQQIKYQQVSPYRGQEFMKSSQPIDLMKASNNQSYQSMQQQQQSQQAYSMPTLQQRQNVVHYDTADIDYKVREALKASEETIQKHSIVKNY